MQLFEIKWDPGKKAGLMRYGKEVGGQWEQLQYRMFLYLIILASAKQHAATGWANTTRFEAGREASYNLTRNMYSLRKKLEAYGEKYPATQPGLRVRCDRKGNYMLDLPKEAISVDADSLAGHDDHVVLQVHALYAAPQAVGRKAS